jgi:hypothetical protein
MGGDGGREGCSGGGGCKRLGRASGIGGGEGAFCIAVRGCSGGVGV